jgi:hypothetical protein
MPVPLCKYKFSFNYSASIFEHARPMSERKNILAYLIIREIYCNGHLLIEFLSYLINCPHNNLKSAAFETQNPESIESHHGEYRLPSISREKYSV